MDAKFYTAALFAGMTANAFKVGTVLSLGWFWMRTGGCHHVYRGQDGHIDYDLIQAVMDLDDSQATIVGQSLPVSTIWHYIRRQASGCGLESNDSARCKVVIDSNGDMMGATPNPPLDLTIEPLASGKFRLRWRYTDIGQETAPTGFHIYTDSGSGFDFTSPDGSVLYELGRNAEYEWVSGELTDGQTYRFCVRSFAESLGSELVINGEFNTKRYWTWGVPWAWSAKKARFESTAEWSYGNLEQDLTISAGQTYRVTFTILAISGADVTPKLGGTDGTMRTAAGTYTEDIVTVGASGATIYADSSDPGDTAEVDDVSVRQVLKPDTESQNTNYVAAVADAIGPAAITGLQASQQDK